MKRNDSTPQRLVEYVPTTPEEKISTFVKRMWQLSEGIDVDNENGITNDREKSANNAKKIKRFLEYIQGTKISGNKRMKDLIRFLKIEAAFYPEAMRMLEDMMSRKLDAKVIIGKTYAPFSANALGRFNVHMSNLFEMDIDYLSLERQKFEAELVLVNMLIGLLSDKELMTQMECKNSWKVATLKEAISEMLDTCYLGEDDRRTFTQILTMQYFRYKKFLSLTVADFKETVLVRKMALERIIAWVDSWSKYIKDERALFEKTDFGKEEKNIYNLLKRYDQSYQHCRERKALMAKQYSLIRYGQGLIKRNIVDSLYK